MRFSLAVTVVLAGISISGLAQQNNTFKVKHSAPEKASKPSAPVGKTAGTTASAANAKNLQALEHQTARTTAPSASPGKKTAPALKPVKDKPNPPINFGETGGGKTPRMTNPGANTQKTRVRQKHTAPTVNRPPQRQIHRATVERSGAGTACAAVRILGSLNEYFNRQYKARTPSFHPIFLPSSYVRPQ